VVGVNAPGSTLSAEVTFAPGKAIFATRSQASAPDNLLCPNAPLEMHSQINATANNLPMEGTPKKESSNAQNPGAVAQGAVRGILRPFPNADAIANTATRPPGNQHNPKFCCTY
jgi:hypothetical protein